MTRHVRLRELAFGIVGVAIMRNLVDGDDDFIQARVEDMRRLVTTMDEPPLSLGIDVPELDPGAGYAAWSTTYDTMANALIELEQPVVHSILGRLAVGSALDAACGTGRHAAFLSAVGHEVVGVDQSSEMLLVARPKVPAAAFLRGALEALPVADAAFDVGVCSLALTHLPRIGGVVAELARAVRPGGHLIISEAHPTFVLIQGQAFFSDADGRFAFVRNHVHLHREYLEAFAGAGLEVVACLEPQFPGLPASGFNAVVADAAKAVWEGIPGALIWHTRKPTG